MDISPPRVKGDKYALESELYSGNKDRCLKFWYHMNGDVGSLTIYRSSTGSQLLEPLWTKSGSQDNIWRLGRASLDKPNKPDNFTILFIGQKGKSDTGIAKSMLISDITI